MKDQKKFEFLTRPNNNQIKQRDEAEIALSDIANITDYIKRELEAPIKKELPKESVGKNKENANPQASSTKI